MAPGSEVKNVGRNPQAADLFLVVDAGGTKTAAWLIDQKLPEYECIVGRGVASAGNPLSVGFPESARAIGEAVAAAKHVARSASIRVPRAILSIAGSANKELQGHFFEALRGLGIAERIAIVSDVLPILAAGTANCQGIALISGTGSVAFARAADGRTTLCGGWGFLLGDEGSGFAIGRAALQFALHDLERNDSRQPLTTAVLSTIEADSVMDVTKTIYRRADPRAAIAAVAPAVIHAAEGYDANAQAIIDSAAADLAKLVTRAAQSIGLVGAPFSLALAGGALTSSSRLRQQLEVELRRIGLAANVKVVDEPLEGCIRLAKSELADTLNWQAV